MATTFTRRAGTTFLRCVWLIVGSFLLAYGLDLQMTAGLGMLAWGVLHEGITRQTPITFGQANILVGIVLLAISTALGVRPRVGTVLCMVSVGLFADLILANHWVPPLDVWPLSGSRAEVAVRGAYLVLGILAMGWGIGWYISADLGAGPRDALMIGLVRRTGWKVGTVRSLLEVVVLLCGWLLGGTVGIGTLIGTATIGWVIQAALACFRRLEGWSPLRHVVRTPVLSRGRAG